MIIKKIQILFHNFYRGTYILYVCMCYVHLSFAGIATVTANNFSAFNELVVAQPCAHSQLQFPYAFINTDYVTTTTATGGTVTAATNLVSLTTTTTSGSSAILSSNRRLHYYPGQGAVCEFTSLFGAGQANNSQIAGLGNAADGLFFGYNGTSFGILNRSSASGVLVDTWIPQSSWNVDTMLGGGGITNPSGITLNPANGNIYAIQVQWLGFGIIRFYIENPNDGSWILVHRILRGNSFTTTTVLNPSMQLYAQNINTGVTASAQTLKICSMAATVEGQAESIENEKNATGTITGRGAPTAAITNVIAIQNKTTFNSVTNQVDIVLNTVSFVTTAGGGIRARIDLYLNPTLSGALTFTDVSTSTSVVQQSSTSVTVTSGKLLMSFYISTQVGFTFDVTDYNIILNPGDVLVAAAQGIGATATVFGSLSWEERF